MLHNKLLHVIWAFFFFLQKYSYTDVMGRLNDNEEVLWSILEYFYNILSHLKKMLNDMLECDHVGTGSYSSNVFPSLIFFLFYCFQMFPTLMFLLKCFQLNICITYHRGS